MGLTKRVDYNGRIKELRPDILVPALDGGPDVVTEKVQLRGTDKTFVVTNGSGDVFTIDDYINPGDPNHLHYYIWRWYAQIAGGTNEVLRHALAGEIGNDITLVGPGFTGSERYRFASYNRSQDRFTVLIYASGAAGTVWSKLAIPATIQNGRYYNNDDSSIDFRGEGFADGSKYIVRIESKNISPKDGSDLTPILVERPVAIVADGMLNATIPQMHRFTKVEFIRVAE